MRLISLLIPSLCLVGCGGTSIQNSSAAANHEVNAINANLSEGAGRDTDSDALRPTTGQPGLKRQEPPRGAKIQ